MPNALSPAQVEAFRADGFIAGLPVFSASELEPLNSGLRRTLALLEPGETTKEIREWHEASRFLFDICVNEHILDYVEGLIGADFFMWASNFFIKEPRTAESVTWHQDAYYWPLEPRASVTAWLAFDDVDAENGAMNVIPGSHRQGLFEHRRLAGAGSSVLDLECDTSAFDLSTVRHVCLAAGEISIHSDQLIHGSPANPSPRRRAGLTIRYSPTEVKCDLSVNPHFKAYLARGTDRYRHNPQGTVPTAMFGRLFREHRSVEEAGADAEDKFWGTRK
jgi:ectoine hydroxylase-related dioxygenase (phytanoyl-CoA dioxygenase family)